jgi:hypothetical protein
LEDFLELLDDDFLLLDFDLDFFDFEGRGASNRSSNISSNPAFAFEEIADLEDNGARGAMLSRVDVGCRDNQ